MSSQKPFVTWKYALGGERLLWTATKGKRRVHKMKTTPAMNADEVARELTLGHRLQRITKPIREGTSAMGAPSLTVETCSAYVRMNLELAKKVLQEKLTLLAKLHSQARELTLALSFSEMRAEREKV